jgi:hypothetical protein
MNEFIITDFALDWLFFRIARYQGQQGLSSESVTHPFVGVFCLLAPRLPVRVHPIFQLQAGVQIPTKPKQKLQLVVEEEFQPFQRRHVQEDLLVVT